MLKTSILIVSLLILSGCGPSYRWINDEYPVADMQDHLEMDKGNCIRESDYTYPDPWPMEDPEDDYYECMAYTSRQVSYPITKEDGTTEYRTVTTRGNPYVCTPSRRERELYRAYENYVRQQRYHRAEYVNSCLSMQGWQRIKIEENTD